MPKNVEIKARARDLERQSRLAEGLGDRAAEHLVQEDTFFNVPSGRLKLRVLKDGSGELIQYERDDSRGPTESRYRCSPTEDPASLEAVLAGALGVRAVVRKKRTVHFAGRTRIHLDRVEGLGDFLELEVKLGPDEDVENGVAVVEDLMSRLEIESCDLVDAAYVDLLKGKVAPKGPDRSLGR